MRVLKSIVGNTLLLLILLLSIAIVIPNRIADLITRLTSNFVDFLVDDIGNPLDKWTRK